MSKSKLEQAAIRHAKSLWPDVPQWEEELADDIEAFKKGGKSVLRAAERMAYDAREMQIIKIQADEKYILVSDLRKWVEGEWAND
jgi:hypothetical protein